jgi:hypothetical protein
MRTEGDVMPTHIEQELGLGPIMHRFRRWVLAKTQPEDQLSLDPLTVNYAAWDQMRRNVRSWPHYVEAPNSIEILVSPEDWDDYWGIDSPRKEEAIASYVRARAASRGYWIAGDPQVFVLPDDTVEIGRVEVVCQFVESADGQEASPVSADDTAPHAPTRVEEPKGFYAEKTTVLDLPADRMGETTRPTETARPGRPVRDDSVDRVDEWDDQEGMNPTVRFVDADAAGEVCLVGDGGFRLVIHSGDCIGAVGMGDEVPPEVNVRLDVEGFPYVDTKQCTLAVVGGRWTITNHSVHGTRLVTREGARLMLGEPEPYPIAEGDVLFLGPDRRLRFELGA